MFQLHRDYRIKASTQCHCLPHIPTMATHLSNSSATDHNKDALKDNDSETTKAPNPNVRLDSVKYPQSHYTYVHRVLVQVPRETSVSSLTGLLALWSH